MTISHALIEMVDECVVQIQRDGNCAGTGFFVAPRQVITCAHVVFEDKTRVVGAERITLCWGGQTLAVSKVQPVPAEHGSGEQFALPDLALLTVEGAPEHQQVLLAQREPDYASTLIARGFSHESERAPDPGLEGRRLTVHMPATEPGCLRVVADAEIVDCMSGSPVIDDQTGLVCGIVKSFRADERSYGGWIVTVDALDRHLPEVRELAGPAPNIRWQTILDLASVTPPSPAVRKNFSDIVAPLPLTHFTERPWLTSRIQAFIDNKTRGYFFVEGKTGVGKTTLAAELARQGNYPYHFCTDRESRTTRTALESLATQLITRYDLKETDEDQDRDDGNPSVFRTLLEEAAKVASGCNEQLVLVIDGLDQAEQCTGTLPLGLPVELPNHVYVIATLRTGRLLDERRQPYEHVTIDQYHSEVLADIRRHIDSTLQIDEQLRARVTDRISVDEFRETIVDRCGGVWIYVSVVLADVRDGRTAADVLSELPTDLWTYYSRTLRDLKTGEDGGLCLPVLSTLACAAEPLSLTTLATLASISVDRQAAVEDMVTSRLQSFVQTTQDKITGPYTPLHDSAREFLTGQEPDTPMTGDLQPLRALAREAVTTHNRITDRYLTAWGDIDLGLPLLVANPELAKLDDYYGLRNLMVHLEHAGREDELHQLLSQYSWFAAHEKKGLYVEYRSDLERGRRLAARSTDEDLAAGSCAPSIGREIRYTLMDASVESISAAITPGLLRAQVERGMWRPTDAVHGIRAVVDYPKRVELVAALFQARFLGDNASQLAETTATQTWDLVFPPRTLRAYDVAGQLLRHLPQSDREDIVHSLLQRGLGSESPHWGWLIRMLSPSLSGSGLERATDFTLTIGRNPEETGAALIGLIPHLPDSMLPRIEQSLDNLYTPDFLKLHRIFALRLAASCHTASDWAIRRIMHEVTQLIGDHENHRELAVLLNGLESTHRAEELDKFVDHLEKEAQQNRFPPYRGNGASFLSEQQVQRALTIARRLPKFDYAHAKALSWLVPGLPEQQRPDVVTEALRRLPRRKSLGDYLRDETLLALAPHVTGQNEGLALKHIRALIKEDADKLGPGHAGMLAILAGRISNRGESTRLRREAVEIARQCLPKLRAEAIEMIAPHLDRDTRCLALDLVSNVEPSGIRNPRWRALDALVAHAQDEDEVLQAKAIAERIHDPLHQARALAGLAGHVGKNTQTKLCGRVSQLVEATDSRERAGALITLASNLPDPSSERDHVLRRAASLIPSDRRVGDRHTGEHLAAVCPILTPQEIQDRLLAAVGNSHGEWEGLDTWTALTPEMSVTHLNKVIRAGHKRRSRTNQYEIAQFIAMIAPHLPGSEIDKARELAEQLHERHRAMPLAALAHRLEESHRSRIIRRVLEDIQPRSHGINVLPFLTPQLLAALVSAMTETERQELIDIVIFERKAEILTLLAALVGQFARLSDSQQEQIMKAAISTLPKSFIVRERFIARSSDFCNIVRHVDVTFLNKVLDAARSSTEDLKTEAVTAVLGSPATARHRSWVAGGNRVGPLRDLFAGLTRPGLLAVLGAAAPHIGSFGGEKAAEECVRAVEDVARWWP